MKTIFGVGRRLAILLAVAANILSTHAEEPQTAALNCIPVITAIVIYYQP